jgi:plastocyanin
VDSAWPTAYRRSMHPTDVASAAWVFASATSKVPFYVAGGLLAFWAVVVAVTGITHPDFPGSGGRARVVMLMSALLVAATVTTALATSGPEGKPAAKAPAQASSTLQLAANATGLLAYDKTSAMVTAGKVAIRFANASPIPHDVTIAQGTKTIAATRIIQGGATAATATLPAGSYVYYCSVDAHRQAGMKGMLTVK